MEPKLVFAGAELVELPALLLRNFDYRLRPRYEAGGELAGIYLDLQAKSGLPIQITALFERGEFVNLATAGLTALDVADRLPAPGPGEPDNPPAGDGGPE